MTAPRLTVQVGGVLAACLFAVVLAGAVDDARYDSEWPPATVASVPGQVVDDTAYPDPAPTRATPAPRPVKAARTRPATPAGFEAWLRSPTARLVIKRESNGQCDVVSATGKYQGKWQADDNFWKAYGGRKYAPNPHQATCHEQDLVAFRGWQERGWQPWTTAP
jgi:hypothetical protein